MIELKHVSKTFDSGSAGGVDALKDVSLTIEDGDIYGIIGMSGAARARWCGASTCWSAPQAARSW